MLGYLSVVVINQGLVKFFLTKQHNVKWEKFYGKSFKGNWRNFADLEEADSSRPLSTRF